MRHDGERGRGVDVIAIILVVFLLIEAIGLSAGARAYAEMFRDFGGQLPLLTRLFIRPWVAWVFAVPLAVFALEGVVRRRADGAMLTRLIVALVGAVALPVGFAIGIYLPLIELMNA